MSGETIPSARTRALSSAVGAYDIRGRIPDELDDDILFALGWATAEAMREIHGSTEVVLGHDMRPSSPELSEAFAAGLSAAGIGDGATVVAYDDAGGVMAARLVWLLRALGESAALLDGPLGALDDTAAVTPADV